MFVLTSLLVFLHLVHAPPEPDKILSETPTAPSNRVTGRFDNEIPFKLPPAAEIAKKNLFHPDRGQKPIETKPPAPPIKMELIELLATFKFGEKQGAIINDATPTAAPPAPATAPAPPPPGGPGKPPAPAAQQQPKKPAPKKIFFVNDTLPSGCILKKVDKNSIVLEYNGVELEPLTLNLNDKDSQKRGQTIVAYKPPTPPAAQAAGKPPAPPPKPGAPGQPDETAQGEDKEPPKTPPAPAPRRHSRFSTPQSPNQ